MNDLILPLVLLGGIGAAVSHIVANRRVKAERRFWLKVAMSTTASAMDAAIRAMCVDFDHDVDTAMKVYKKALDENYKSMPGNFPRLPEPSIEMVSSAKEQIAKARKAIGKEPVNGDTKSA